MISPNLGADLAEEMARAAVEAELTILRRVTELLSQGITTGPNLDWQREQLANVQKLRMTLESELRVLNDQAATTLQHTLSEAYSTGASSALRDLSGFVTAANTITAPATSRALQAIGQELLGKVADASTQILRQTPDLYREVVARAVEQSTIGSITRKQATQQALDALLGNGITVAPSTGRGRMSLGDYVTMATRTASTNAAIAGHTQALADHGLNLVVIQLGPRPCEICDGWANKVLSTDGTTGTITTTDYSTGGTTQVRIEATLEQARAAGWGHPNCRCGIKAYIPGVTKIDTRRLAWDKEGYEAQQEQRRLEREIRKAKTEAATAVDEVDAQAANQRVKDLQAQMRQHMDDHPYLKRQYSREQVANLADLPPVSKKPNGGPGWSRLPDDLKEGLADLKPYMYLEDGPTEPRVYAQSLSRSLTPEQKKLLADHFAQSDTGGIYLGGYGTDITDLDELSDLKGVRPRGHDEGSTWETVGGLYRPTTRVVAVADPSYSGSLDTMLHEISHALDDAAARRLSPNLSGGWTATPQFRSAVDAVMDDTVKSVLLPYYSPSGNPTGFYSEIWAEGGAYILNTRRIVPDANPVDAVIRGLMGVDLEAFSPSVQEQVRESMAKFAQVFIDQWDRVVPR